MRYYLRKSAKKMFDILHGQLYLQNQATIRRYTQSHYKVTTFSALRQGGLDGAKKNFTNKGKAGNADKLSSSISRSKSKVFELAECNQWELFVTFTLDKKKYDRKDLEKYNRDLSQFIRNYNRLKQTEIKYLLIPEQHEDGAWHMHGLIKGLPVEHLHKFKLSEKLPYRIRERIESGHEVFTWTAYAEKFGFSSIELVGNLEAVSKYITKYITEDMQSTIKELNAHMYYSSKGLKRSTVVMSVPMRHALQEVDYQNEYIAVKNCKSLEEAKAILA